MREIKFRGKTKLGEWIYGYYAKDEKTGKCFILVSPKFNLWEVIPKTVGQYTGQDYNGIQVYEGHKVEYDNADGYGISVEVVEFVDGEFKNCNIHSDWHPEVIGNIFEDKNG